MQDGVILYALETASHGKNIDDRRYSSEGSLLKANGNGFKKGFAIYVGDKVSLAHGVYRFMVLHILEMTHSWHGELNLQCKNWK